MATHVDMDDLLWARADVTDKDVPVASIVDGESRVRTILDEMMGLFVEEESYACFKRVGNSKGYSLRNKDKSLMLAVKVPANREALIEITNAHSRGIFALEIERTDEDAFDFIYRDQFGKTFVAAGPEYERSCFSVQGTLSGTGFGSTLHLKFAGDSCFGPFLNTYIADDDGNILATISNRPPSADHEFTGFCLDINKGASKVDLGLVVLMFVTYVMLRDQMDE